MDYKTIRYPGHCEQMRLLMNGLKLNQDRGTLKRILENAVPQTLQDVVIVYAAVTGLQDGELREENYVNKIYPQVIGGPPLVGDPGHDGRRHLRRARSRAAATRAATGASSRQEQFPPESRCSATASAATTATAAGKEVSSRMIVAGKTGPAARRTEERR